jgi:hypothetical protein
MYPVKDVSEYLHAHLELNPAGFDLNRLNIVAKVGKVRTD